MKWILIAVKVACERAAATVKEAATAMNAQSPQLVCMPKET